MLALGTAGASACEKINPEFIEPTETGTVDSTATAGSVGDPTTGPGPTTGSVDSTTGGSTADSTSGGLACAPQFESIRIAVFEPKCTGRGCHEGKDPAASLDLTTADVFEDLLDIPSATCVGWSRVVAQSPELSILYARVAGIATCEALRPVEHEILPAEELECLAGWIDSLEDCERCGGTECIDLATDPAHCGGCDAPCPAGIACVGGSCDCDTLLACDRDCVDPQTDPLHCGGCEGDCNGATCTDGLCDCDPMLLDCGACVDPMSDEEHCGGCNQPCDLGETCQMGQCLCSDIPVSFAGQVQPILTDNCVQGNCHSGPNPKQDLNLEEGLAIANLVDVLANECNDGRLRVAPGDPDNSYLMDKVLGVDLCGGVQMPQSGGPGAVLTDAELDPMTAWICQGAQDN